MIEVITRLFAEKYDDYTVIILTSILIVGSSYFTMWCILSNCLARCEISKIIKKKIFFLPLAGRYAIEYPKMYWFHSTMYCCAMTRIAVILLLIFMWEHNLTALPLDNGWSYPYFLWTVFLLALSAGTSWYWDSCNDSQNINGQGGRTMDEKQFDSAEALQRLKKCKELYLLQKRYCAKLKKKYVVRTACTMQMVQAWHNYLIRNNLYRSISKRDEIFAWMGVELQWMSSLCRRFGCLEYLEIDNGFWVFSERYIDEYCAYKKRQNDRAAQRILKQFIVRIVTTYEECVSNNVFYQDCMQNIENALEKLDLLLRDYKRTQNTDLEFADALTADIELIRNYLPTKQSLPDGNMWTRTE